MDEPCSALDPIATLQIEDLMDELKENYTIVIVTHNMQQAARVSDYTAFLSTGRRPRRYWSNTARPRDLHQPPEQAHRGLRLRALRLSGGGATDLETSTAPAARARTPGAASTISRRPSLSNRPARPSRRPTESAALRPRSPRSRTSPADGLAGQGADPCRHRVARRARRRRRPAGDPRRPADQRGPAQGHGDDRRGHRHPEADRPRPALPAARWTTSATSWSAWATTRAPWPSRRGNWPPIPRSRTTCCSRSWASGSRTWCRG